MSQLSTTCQRPSDAPPRRSRYGGGPLLVHPTAEDACCEPTTAGKCSAQAARRMSWDSWGVLASSLCVIHCVAVPLVLPALAMCGFNAVWAGCCSNDFFHLALFCAVAPVGLIALTAGHRRHRRAAVLAVGLVGIALLASALAVSCGDPTLLFSERLLTVGGSAVLIGAHAWNRRCLRN